MYGNAPLFPSQVVVALFHAQSHRIESVHVVLFLDVCVKCMLNTFDMHESGTHVTSCLVLQRHPQPGEHITTRPSCNVSWSTLDLTIGKRLFMLPSGYHLDSELAYLWT